MRTPRPTLRDWSDYALTVRINQYRKESKNARPYVTEVNRRLRTLATVNWRKTPARSFSNSQTACSQKNRTPISPTAATKPRRKSASPTLSACSNSSTTRRERSHEH